MRYLPPSARLLSFLFFCLLLAGCSLLGSSGQTSPELRTFSSVERFIITHTPGTPDASGIVSDPAFGEALRIILEKEFLSASGETCRSASVFSPEGNVEVVVMCRDKTGDWSMVPRVWGQGVRPKQDGGNAPATTGAE